MFLNVVATEDKMKEIYFNLSKVAPIVFTLFACLLPYLPYLLIVEFPVWN